MDAALREKINKLYSIPQVKKLFISFAKLIEEGSETDERVDAILKLIPTQASELNKLTDKNFVNSSISTNTATFKGTVNDVTQLNTIVADNNDYAFVIETDSAGNTIYNRYKYNGTSWSFEYSLNNSSFTSAQWAAINSGATDVLINKIPKDVSRTTTDACFMNGSTQLFWLRCATNSLAGLLTAALYTKLNNLPIEKGTADYSIKQDNCTSEGIGSVALGRSTASEAMCSFAEGELTQATAEAAHAEGKQANARGIASHAEGWATQAGTVDSYATASYSHAEGNHTQTNNIAEHAEGAYNKSNSGDSTADKTLSSIGIGTTNSTRKNAVEVMQNADVYIKDIGGYDGTNYSTANTLQQVVNAKVDAISGKGLSTEDYTTAEKTKLGDLPTNASLTTTLSGKVNVVSGKGLSTEDYTTAEKTKLANVVSNIENGSGTTIFGDGNYPLQQKKNTASGKQSFAEGNQTTASGNFSHSEGNQTTASGICSHAEGSLCEATQTCSHAEGGNTKAAALYSHAEGWYTETSNTNEHAQGTYNKSNSGTTTDERTLSSIGYGTSNFRKNAVEVMQNGDVYITGLGNYDGTAIGTNISTLQQVIANLITRVTNLENA